MLNTTQCWKKKSWKRKEQVCLLCTTISKIKTRTQLWSFLFNWRHSLHHHLDMNSLPLKSIQELYVHTLGFLFLFSWFSINLWKSKSQHIYHETKTDGPETLMCNRLSKLSHFKKFCQSVSTTFFCCSMAVRSTET